MKKTLVAVAALAAFAGAAMAEVTAYGVVDTAVKFTNVKVTGEGTTRKVSMEQGVGGGNRWGLKGVEELGAGYKIGFILEGGYKADSGKVGDSSRIFNRQSELDLYTPAGTFKFGRMGTITGGTNGGIIQTYSGFGTAYADVGASNDILVCANNTSRVDNAVRYDSPKFAGFQVIAQYSDSIDSVNEGARAGSTGYLGAVVQYKQGGFSAALGFDQAHIKGNDTFATPAAKANNRTYSAVASYDFGGIKGYLNYQHYTGLEFADNNGNTYQVSADFPVFGGKLMTTLGYKKDDFNKDWRIGAGYKYNLSKRTFAFGSCAFLESRDRLSNDAKTKQFAAAIGLHHSF